MEIPQVNNLLSSVTRITNSDLGYTVNTVTHEQSAGKITSVKTEYTVYDGSAQIEHNTTSRNGQNIDTVA